MLNSEDEQEETFRDSISTVDKQGKRVWLFPKKPKGKLYNYRSLVGYLLLVILFLTPLIKVNGEQLILFNVIERKFVFFGNIFWPQDFHIFALGMITLVIFVILFTVVYGRVFCGWVCPQTIFMEMLFRKIEYLIEGDWKDQKRLKASPWNTEKVLKKGSKHFIFFTLSFLISNTFLAYIIGSDELFKIVTDPPSEHVGGLISIVAFTYVFYFVFSWFREQVCTVVCPYGRLQGVLLDKNSIVVAYDYNRGDPKGKLRIGENRSEVGKGDCIDCHQCVDVCPTGIDIRNGTQLECVNCTACIDVCNSMMDKAGLDRGLIRYDSEQGISISQRIKFNARRIAYTVVLLILVGTMTGLMINRSDVEMTVLRTPGVMYQKRDNNEISNLYNYKIVNKSHEEFKVQVKLLGRKGRIEFVGKEILLEPNSVSEGALFIYLNRKVTDGLKTKLKLGVYRGDEELEVVKTNFLGPSK